MGRLLRRTLSVRDREGHQPSSLQPTAATPQGLDLAIELAHDIRSPLSAVISLAELLDRTMQGPVTEAQHRHVRMLLDSARAIGRLTDELVASVRLGGRGGREVPSPFSVNGVLETVREMARPMAESARLDLTIRSPGLIHWIGRGDAVTRVLLNLTTNALKYTASGGVEVGARAVSERDLEFFVRDTGVGLSPNSESQAASSAACDPWRASSGLGLAICRRLLQEMHTTLEVDSQPGVGTECHFTLSLPTPS